MKKRYFYYELIAFVLVYVGIFTDSRYETFISELLILIGFLIVVFVAYLKYKNKGV